MEEIRQDRDVVEIKKSTGDIVTKVTDLKITDERASKYATDMLAFIKKAFRRIEDKRKFFVRPLNEHVKDINNEFKTMTEPLKEAEGIVKKKLLGWMAEVKAKEEEAAKKAQEGMNTVINKLGLPPVEAPATAPQTQIRGSMGKSYTKKVWAYDITDFAQVPDEYKGINTVAVGAAIRAGKREISGLKIYQKDTIAVK